MADPLRIAESLAAATAAQASSTSKQDATYVEVGKEFKAVLLESLERVNRLQTEADGGVQKLLTGETQNVAEVLAAVNKAGIAFDLLMEIRNQLMEAYQEIKQMQV